MKDQKKSTQKTSSPLGTRDWEEALDILNKVLEKKPNDSILLLEKVHLLFRMGFYRECLSMCREIEKTDKERWEFILIQAACENWMARQETLLSEIRKCQPIDKDEVNKDFMTLLCVFCDADDASCYMSSIAENNNEPEYWHLLARIQRANGSLKDALGSIEKALLLNKDFAPASELKEKIMVEILRGAAKTQKHDTFSDSSIVQESKAGFTAEDWMVRGLALEREENYEEALKSFSESLKMDSKMTVCLFYEARVKYLSGDISGATDGYQKFIDTFPKSSGFYKEMIIRNGKNEKKEKLEGYYQKWIGLFPIDHNAWMAYLRYLAGINDVEGSRLIALEILEKAMYSWHLPQSSGQFQCLRGILELYLERIRSAKNTFLQVLKYDSSNQLAMLGLGKCYETLGRSSEAEEQFVRVSKLEGTKVFGLYQLSNICMKSRNKEKALAYINEALNVVKVSNVLKRKKAEIYLESGDVKSFIEYYSQIEKKSGSYTPLLLLKSMLLFKAKRYEEAILNLENARSNDYSNSLIMKDLGILYLKTRENDKAIKIVNEMAKTRKGKSEYLLIQGMGSYYIKEFKQALKVLEDYMNLYPLDPRLWIFLAFTEYYLGNYEIAGICFQKVKELCGGLHHSWLNLGIYHCEIGDYAKALECLDVIKENSKDSFLFTFCYAKCLMKLKRYDEALKMSDLSLKIENDNVSAIFLKALIEFGKNDYEASLSTFARLLEKDNENVEILYLNAINSMYCNNITKAVESIEQALQIKPDYYEALLANAVLGWMTNDLNKAKNALESAKSLKPDEFANWLNVASSTENHLSTLKFSEKIEIPFHIPVVFFIDVEEPVNIFQYELQDTFFKSN